MKARPEPTQLEHLSDASFFGKLLVLPANVRLDWKVIARYKHSSLFGLVNGDKGKMFYNIDTWKAEKLEVAGGHPSSDLPSKYPKVDVSSILFRLPCTVF